MTSGSKKIKTVQLSYEVLETTVKKDGARVTEIANSLEIAPSTAHNHLQTLRSEGYIINDGGIYFPSNQFLWISEYARRRKTGYQMAKSRVQSLTEETGGRNHFVIEEHGKGRYLYTDTGDLAVKTFARNGDNFLLHATAGGKAILSRLPDTRVKEIINEHGLNSQTSQTITNREKLFKELEEVRDRGTAFNLEEHNKGISAVSAPVLEPNGGVLGAFTVSGPAKRFTEELLQDELADIVLATANELELEIMYSE